MVIFLVVFINSSNKLVKPRVEMRTCGIYESCKLYGGKLTILENGVTCEVIND